MKGNSEIMDDSIPPGNNYNKALFRIRIPDQVERIRGVLVLVPGSNGDGRDAVSDPEWLSFAEEHQLALLGCFFTDFQHKHKAVEYYARASEGSGDALLQALAHFAEKSKHDELHTAPLLLWGHSAGGQFNYEFTCWKPDRVFAFVVNKGGVYFTNLASPETWKVPGIFFTGEKDMEFRNNVVEGIFTLNRRLGARWCYAPEPGTAHEIAGTKRMAMMFFKRLLSYSVDKKDLQPVPELESWIGDYHLMTIMPEKTWTQKDYPDSWLPDEDFAVEWLHYILAK